MDALQDQVARLNASLVTLEQQLAEQTLYSFPGAEDINTGYTLMSGYLVFFMQAGFAMLSAGSVRAKNAKNIILLNLLDACFGCLAWYATGWAFAFGDPPALPASEGGGFAWQGSPFIGHKYFFQSGLDRTSYGLWFFQFTFAATSATIVSGAVAERCKFECYICYNLMLVSFVYPVVAHWVWSPWGWLSAWRTPETASSGYTLLFNSGVYDFAGDGPVHMVGGFASLVAAWVLGARIGRFDAAGTPVDMPGHNASLTLLGVFLLWFGWYGFNPGSTTAILGSYPGYSSISAAIAVNTTISAAAATVSTLFISMLHQYLSLGVVVWDLIIAGNGALAGLVAITGGCAFVQTWAAMIIGFVAGCVYYLASKLILHKLRIDDPLDAIAVHAGGAIWGMLGCAAFAAPNMVEDWFGPYPGAVAVDGVYSPRREYGFVMGGSGALLAAHLVYILAIAAWVLGIMTPFFLLLRRLGLMRVPADVEAMGLDISYHGGSSYPHERSHQPNHGGSLRLGSEAYMTRDQVERLLEQTVMGLEKRFAQQQQAQRVGAPAVQDVAAPLPAAVGLTAVAVAPHAGAGMRGAAGQEGSRQSSQEQQYQQYQQQQQYKAVKALKPLMEGPEGAEAAGPPASGGSAHGGGSTHGGGMPRIGSLSQLQQHMTRAYHHGGTTSGTSGGQSGGDSGSGVDSQEGTRHSHVSWADGAPPASKA